VENKVFFMLADGVVGCSRGSEKKLNYLLSTAKRMGITPSVREVLVIIKNNDDMMMDCVVIETVPISGD